MEYNIQLTEGFLEEINDICKYISLILKAPKASYRLREKVMSNVLLLEKSPRLFTKIEKTDKTERQYRKIVVNNYVILYTIDEEKETIYIVHIYYEKRNYIEYL